jgi:hypothetical protein
MNLWAKSFGRLTVLAVALFFFSCEDETSLLGLKNPNPKFNVTYVEIPIESSVLSIDSVYTDNKTSVGGVLVGQYFDNQMGNIRSEAYLQIVPGTSALIPEGAVYDSLTVQFRLNYYSYGFSGDQTEKFTIHEITGDTLSRMLANRYKASSTIAYDPTPMDEAVVDLDYDSLKKQYALAAASQDTLITSARLSDLMGQQIFNLASEYGFSKNNPDVIEFISKVKGIVMVPSQSSGIFGIRIGDGLSRVTLHYHTVTNGTTTPLTKSYGFSSASFSNITTDRASTELSPLMQPYQSLLPGSGMRYLQSGTPLVTKLDFTKFYEFADTLENVIVNEAELIISGVESPSGLSAHSSLVLKPMREDNQFFNVLVPDDSVIRPNYILASTADPLDIHYKHYFVNSDVPSSQPSAAVLGYNSTDKEYAAFITLFVQTLFKNKVNANGINPSRLKYLALYPVSPSTMHTVNRTLFPGDKVKLRIYYTQPAINSTP